VQASLLERKCPRIFAAVHAADNALALVACDEQSSASKMCCAWDDIPLTIWQGYALSMPTRTAAVIEAHGGATRYWHLTNGAVQEHLAFAARTVARW
jgi:hypothetical protein